MKLFGNKEKKRPERSRRMPCRNRILPLLLCVAFLGGILEPLPQAGDIHMMANKKTAVQIKKDQEQAKEQTKKEVKTERSVTSNIYRREDGQNTLETYTGAIRHSDSESKNMLGRDSALEKKEAENTEAENAEAENAEAENTDTYVRDGELTKRENYVDSPVMGVGSLDGDTLRSYLSFSELSELLEDKYIKSAVIQLTESEDSETDVSVQAHPVTSSWKADELVGIHQPKWNMAALTEFTTKGKADTVHSLDVTDYVTDLLKGTNPDYGLVLSADANARAKSAWFHTAEALDVRKRPLLTVTYYDEPTAPNIKLEPAYIKPGQPATLSWWGTQSQDLHHMEYSVQEQKGQKKIVSVKQVLSNVS